MERERERQRAPVQFECAHKGTATTTPVARDAAAASALVCDARKTMTRERMQEYMYGYGLCAKDDKMWRVYDGVFKGERCSGRMDFSMIKFQFFMVPRLVEQVQLRDGFFKLVITGLYVDFCIKIYVKLFIFIS